MSEHHEYPLTMAHPAYQASKALPVPGTEKRNALGQVISQDYQGTPERFAPVTVADDEQRQYYEAQGYLPAGKSDPAAYATAHASPAPPDYKPEEYPKWRDGVLVESADDEAEKFPEVEKAQAIGTVQVSDQDVAALRQKYEAQFGKKPFMGWDAGKLLEKLAA